jgi:GTP cyclohydrolase I
MTAIEVPVRLRGADDLQTRVPAKADAFVSLDDPAAKGIHMSRLYLALNRHLEAEVLTPALVGRILSEFLESHVGLSHAARLSIGFELPLRRPALKSANSAWRTYPVTVSGDLAEGRLRLRLGVTVAYSSTCPCSAALARQLVQEHFLAQHHGRAHLTTDEVAAWLGQESSIIATPHAQRSYAVLEVEAAADQVPTHEELIDLVEGALKTPVQAAVKRADEQEFARLNGTNLMFCEDAARRMQAALDADPRIADWRVEAVHVESLHPHNAVAIAAKGVPGGFVA